MKKPLFSLIIDMKYLLRMRTIGEKQRKKNAIVWCDVPSDN